MHEDEDKFCKIDVEEKADEQWGLSKRFYSTPLIVRLMVSAWPISCTQRWCHNGMNHFGAGRVWSI
jgi:hypothetical protein